MESRVVFRRLSPSNSNALCSILELNGFTLLLDAGWDAPFRPSDLMALEQVARKVDAVLLTQPSLRCCGALPYAFAHCGLAAPVYAITSLREFATEAVIEAWDALRAHWRLLQTKNDLAHFVELIRAEQDDDDDDEDSSSDDDETNKITTKKETKPKQHEVEIPLVCFQFSSSFS